MKETEKIEIMHFDQEGYLEDGKALYETGKKMIVKGVVRDVQAKTLDDVKVSVKGRKGSVITNGKGEYSIEATSASVLVFSRKGYEMQEVEVNSQKTLNITLLNKI